MIERCYLNGRPAWRVERDGVRWVSLDYRKLVRLVEGEWKQ